ncbi:beta-ketoacyl-[acyl-carrier-protein] synthase family protein [Guyparkeria hydrothermalis]|uniref:beta-ketoacyl-[acyl-carrier-protein] synthase family protein n=1 Tax=Guyparkeria hydrothermalis TaxID=923 RepID=UPI0020222FD3|nr:beta-ketoacyl-[acyl-carrier-protein] synthase family protein [Guyparkeria hydrothermalis]MCL7743818.1 beta-ketoacyl-[acyl-carrier-protein] synthase family protein [Guyparkeria hydrothermalis]
MSERRTRERVVVTGLSLLDPLGGNTDTVMDRLLTGESSVRLLDYGDETIGGRTPAVFFEPIDFEARLGKATCRSTDPFARLALLAADEAWENAGLSKPTEVNPRAGVNWGTALGGINTFENGYRSFWKEGRKRLSPMSVVMGMNNAASAQIGIRFGLGGQAVTHSVACASGAIAIGDAYERIRDGHMDLMLAGGSDLPLALGVLRAWDAMHMLAPGDETTAHRACRPFHPERRGLVLAEGAACLVLESLSHAQARGATILAEVGGFGASNDANHVVRPQKDGQVRAIQRALADAELPLESIGYVNAHGTATTEGDAVEVSALREVFGDELAARLPVSATKAAHGHAMGATGAIEAAITIMALQRERLPPTAHLDQVDPACEGVDHIRERARDVTGIVAALSNSFAFGGSNAVLAFARRNDL